MVMLRTERLIIRDYDKNDLNDLHKLLSDKKNMYFLDDISTDTIEQTRENLDMVIANTNGHYFCIVENKTNKFVGSVGYTITSENQTGKVVHMGYFILPEFQGMGYTTEAVKRVLEFTFCQDGCAIVTSACYKENEPSRRVMEKAGFRKVVEHVQVQYHDGLMKDRLEYAISKDEFQSYMPSNQGSDEEIARLAKEGDKAALDSLLKQYIPLVHSVVKGLGAPGAERDDFLQEGMIGLYHAVLAYDPNRASRFYFFAKLCVERRLHTALKAALRGKHTPLSAFEPISPDMRDYTGTPEEIFLTREEISALKNNMNTRLSELERRALSMRLTGLGSGEIAKRLGLARKVVDNALWRVKRKLGAI